MKITLIDLLNSIKKAPMNGVYLGYKISLAGPDKEEALNDPIFSKPSYSLCVFRSEREIKDGFHYSSYKTSCSLCSIPTSRSHKSNDQASKTPPP